MLAAGCFDCKQSCSANVAVGMADIEDFAQQLFSRINIRLKSPFREARQQSNGEMELGDGSVWMTSGTQTKSVLKDRDRDVEVGVCFISLAINKLCGS
jgi:hypothetical protein